ncbi:Phytochelatin Synthase, Glutathione gamma-glutamylcysteinyltransferase [Melia azedarach]|uniref:Phytochelatin Synthase, Glutathione gamma-glutamylcysteinyltransferase n=1 Tax=Melia azedarach TaxID=155640 RepID=A0ACC1YUT9_MELAZ|nr:Phytochelatin Synthase, Glutathione gamma-glutamylcysteinyltransferase [Melia azedarach]
MTVAGFYRRVLPSPPATEFASPQGKQLFREALDGGTMEGFFKLVSYYQTQSEPAYCGLASLAVVLNALAIDPGRKWKGPWRWFDDTMLDCCEALSKIKDEGITFGKVACLAYCNGANVEAFRTSETSIDDFRRHVISSATSEDCHIITSYHRGVLKQSCGGKVWIKVAKYLTEDVPYRLKSDDMKDVESLLSIFKSAPAELKEFIKWWVAEVCRQEDGSSEEEKKGGLVMKEDVLKQIRETELFKHVNILLTSEISLCNSTTSCGLTDELPELAANICCQGAELLSGKLGSSNGTFCREANMTLITADGEKPMTVVSGTTTANGIDRGIETLVPLSGTEPSNCKGMHPSTADVLTVLLLALPQHTWCGIKERELHLQFSSLASIDNLPPLLQQEVLHLRRELHFLMIDLSTAPSPSV